MKKENIFDATYFLIKNEENILNKFLLNFDKWESVLDLGAWSQPYRKAIESASIQYSSVDIAWEQDYKLNLNTDLLPFKDQSIDGVTFFQTLEHLSEPYHALDEAFRVLKSGGYTFISTPFLFALHGIPHDFYRYTEYFYHHVAEKYDLEIVSISSGVKWLGTIIYLFNHFVDYFSFFWPWRILISLPICLWNILIWILEKINPLIPKTLRFSLSERLASDYVVIFRKK
ncbi:MAG: Methyltransferase type 11 [uncultured bacterium (gcode 4)]|uniref:Methyltransferase type 11 n=1 Tax=uncultured bacterium (gcode 4) TaxID=1234023 RepID=K1ZI77_9BACT|nr:MAG: Methyltransferase type 11 [uncultured bacterium (gcode 4)]